MVKRYAFVIAFGLGMLPAVALATTPMYDYWSDFTNDVIIRAVSLASDLIPILALLGGLAIAERVARFVLGSARG